VAPPTGARVLLALPSLHSRAFPPWLDGCAAAVPASLPRLVRAHGAGHTATAVRWPSKVGPGFLPPSRPELTPSERLWRDRKDKRAALSAQTLDAVSEAVCAILQPDAPATLQSLTSFAYVVQAVDTVQNALYV
jgi:hypothetical protein